MNTINGMFFKIIINKKYIYNNTNCYNKKKSSMRYYFIARIDDFIQLT